MNGSENGSRVRGSESMEVSIMIRSELLLPLAVKNR